MNVDLDLPWSVDDDASWRPDGTSYVVISDAQGGIPCQCIFETDDPEDEARVRAVAARICEVMNASAAKKDDDDEFDLHVWREPETEETVALYTISRDRAPCSTLAGDGHAPRGS